MTDRILIDRELLERCLPFLSDTPDLVQNGAEALGGELRAILAAPRQPEEDAASILLPALRQYMHNDGSGLLAGYEYERTQQIVAELREECEHLKDCQENAMLHMTGLVSERDTLRQQLAERDATIARLEAGIPRIQEQSHQMRQQRDQLRAALAAPVQGEAVPVEDRGWPDRDYWCKCSLCLHEFTGHKRQVICRVCSEQQDELATPPQPADVGELVEALRAADEYLSSNRFNEIGSGSILHRQMQAALAKLEGKA